MPGLYVTEMASFICMDAQNSGPPLLQTREYLFTLVTLLAEDWTSRVTPLGYSISAFPVAPRFGKMLALSHQHGLLPYTVCMVAALSVQEVLLEAPIHGSQEETENLKQTRAQWAQTRRRWAGFRNSLLLGDCNYILTFLFKIHSIILTSVCSLSCNENLIDVFSTIFIVFVTQLCVCQNLNITAI
jgi:HrpA-like RNA helicase